MNKLALTVRYRDDIRHLHPTVLLSDSWPCKKARICSSLDSRSQILILNDSSCWYPASTMPSSRAKRAPGCDKSSGPSRIAAPRPHEHDKSRDVSTVRYETPRYTC